MEKGAYGIVRLFYTHDMMITEEVLNFRDGQFVGEKSVWEEIKLTKPGSLQYDFEMINGVNICKSTLTFNALCDLYNDGRDVFFLALDVKGNKHIIGLGDKYDTVPKLDMTDAISDSAAEGTKLTIKVTWSNICGRLFAL